MYVILLKFSENREQASRYMNAHLEWLNLGFSEGVFILAGSLKPKLGGAIIAKGSSLEMIQKRVDLDPFVSEKIVESEILEISPSKMDERFSTLLQE